VLVISGDCKWCATHYHRLPFICDRMWIPERDKVPVSPMSFHSYVSLSHHMIGTRGLLVFRAELVTRSSVHCIPPAAKVPETGVSVTLRNQSQNPVPSSHSSFRIWCPKDVLTEMKVNFNQFPITSYTLYEEAQLCAQFWKPILLTIQLNSHMITANIKELKKGRTIWLRNH
jgi:hypothetical protein